MLDESSLFLILVLSTSTFIQPTVSNSRGLCYDDRNKTELTTSMTFVNESIERHNYYRDKHGACPLAFSRNLSEAAQSWANFLASRFRDCREEECLQHSLRPCVGENLVLKGANHSFTIDGNFAVDEWYGQTKDYVFSSGKSRFGGVGELTQVLWTGTKEVGVAFAEYEKDGWKWVIVVANYFPPGNLLGQSLQHVFPEGTSPPSAADCESGDWSSGAVTYSMRPNSVHLVSAAALALISLIIAYPVLRSR